MKSEIDFIQQLKELFPVMTDSGILGIGDDCSVIPFAGKNLLVTKDMLVEDIHFILKQTRPRHLGMKAMNVNLSDIAAMGGKPLYAFLGLSFPKTLHFLWIQEFLSGLKDVAEQEGVLILGGDTTASTDKITIDVTIIGEGEVGKIKLRSHVQAGDLILTTGALGDSAAGFKLLQAEANMNSESQSQCEIKKSNAEKQLITIHQQGQHHLAKGQWLAQMKDVHGMMDISDGVDLDVKRLCFPQNLMAIIYLDELPLSAELKEVAAQYGWPRVEMEELAATGGEDYSLLLTMKKSAYASINEKFEREFGHPLYLIGRIEIENENEEKLVYWRGKEKVLLTSKGFDHFE